MASAQNDILEELYESLSVKVRERFSIDEIEDLRRAYEYGVTAHIGQLRKSGEPFYIHPLEVTILLADLGMGSETLIAGLLHDAIEDTDATYDDIAKLFSPTIANLVDGVTKLTKLEYGENANAETIRKMIVAMSKDIRVLIIKLADRLHNARTWKYVPIDSATKKARETLDIYAPLAHRLGLNQFKRELEDLSFKMLYPKVAAEIEALVREYAPERDRFVEESINQVIEVTDRAKINADVFGRPKHLYSIYQKMIVKGRDFKDIYDLVGIRIITNTVLDCYAALGAVHSKWNHLPGRFKDYIAMPKYNMYQSIHTTVMGPAGRTIEIQIRTKEMHQFAQYGVAAHWRYKAVHRGEAESGTKASILTDEEYQQTEENLKWIKQLVDWQHETDDSEEFLDSLRFDLNSDEVYIFSPKGAVFSLPRGSTPVDFAYTIHTEVGHKTMGARVNSKLVSLSSELQNGDTVEILTTKAADAGPSRDWLSFVKSQRARNKIRLWFSKSRRDEDIEKGRNELANAIKGKNLPMKRMLTHEVLLELADEMKQKSVDDLYQAIGRGDFQASTVLNHILDKQRDEIADEIVDEKTVDLTSITKAPLISDNSSHKPLNTGIEVSGLPGENDVWIKLAKCCTPVPGDKIIGFVTRGQGITIHRADCYNIHVLREEMDAGRFIEANWIKGAKATFLANIQVEGLDRAHLLADITRVLSENHVDIISGQVETTKDRVAISRWTFEMGDAGHLASLMSAIRKVDGVFDVYRVTGKTV